MALAAQAQIRLAGVVTDDDTGLPVERAAVINLRDNSGTLADDDGNFVIYCHLGDSLQVSALGYEAQRVIVTRQATTIAVTLKPTANVLGEIVVRSKKYSKKNNPAVDLIRRLLEKRDQARLDNLDYYARTSYRRVAYGLNRFETASDNSILNRFPFLARYADTLSIHGVATPVLPVSVDELTAVERHWRDSTSLSQQHAAHAGLDDEYDQTGIKTYIENLIGAIDIFQGSVQCLNNRFASPISSAGLQLYRYYLGDTVVVDGERFVQLDFAPHNSQDLGFVGRMLVACDSSLFVRRVTLAMPRGVNINFATYIAVTQEFTRVRDNLQAIADEDIVVVFTVFKNAQSLFAQVNSRYDAYTLNPDVDLRADATRLQADGLAHSDDLRSMVAELRSDRRFFWGEFALTSVIQDFIPTAKRMSSSRFDFGPISSFFSSNSLEGFKTRIGGQTTTAFSRWIELAGYVAMGWKDHKLKYGAQATFSFTPKERYFSEALTHSITVSHSYDTYLLGSERLFSPREDFLLPITRKPDDKWIYQRRSALTYQKEWNASWLMSLALQHNRFMPSRKVPFVNGLGESLSHYGATGMNLSVRYAHNERFMATLSGRAPMGGDATVVILSHQFVPDALGNKRASNLTVLGIHQRFWMPAWGFLDFIVKGEKQWNRVHFFDLPMPCVDLTYNLQPESFALMNVMEFAADEQLSWFVKCRLNGVLLNRVPLIKRLKMREVIIYRGLWGRLTDNNNPALHPELLQFPAEVITRLDKKPYMEFGLGVENLFRILSLQYVWRLNYRDVPNVERSGLRFQLSLSF